MAESGAEGETLKMPKPLLCMCLQYSNTVSDTTKTAAISADLEVFKLTALARNVKELGVSSNDRLASRKKPLAENACGWGEKSDDSTCRGGERIFDWKRSTTWGKRGEGRPCGLPIHKSSYLHCIILLQSMVAGGSFARRQYDCNTI